MQRMWKVMEATKTDQNVQAGDRKIMAAEFWRTECGECGNRQRIFSRVSNEVKCAVCGEELASPTGGKALVHGQIVEQLITE